VADEDLTAGYGTQAANRSPIMAGALHVILLAACSVFLVPFIWMAVTSLKPIDQTMKETMIPKATLAMLNGKETLVVRKEQLKGESLLVRQGGGQDAGKVKLIPALFKDAPAVVNGMAQMKFTRAGREEYEPELVKVEVLRTCPKGYWLVEEWAPEFSQEREENQNKELAWDCVPESELKEVPHLFWSNYKSALSRMQGNDEGSWYSVGFFRYLLNTLFLCGMTVTGMVVACTMVAYAFAFLEFPGRNVLFGVTLAVMMVPFPATMVPSFDLFRSLGWTGTFKPLWVPAWFGGAFFIFLLRQFFLGLPKDLLDAARIDGCTELEILWHVVVPLARPALAMVALFQFLHCWNDFMGPMLYLNDSRQFTLSLGLQALQSQHGGTPMHLSMAASMMFSLPLVILFMITRKTFMKGIAMTGIKG